MSKIKSLRKRIILYLSKFRLYKILRFLRYAYTVYQRSDLIQLADSVRSDKGFIYHHYVRVYEQILKPIRYKELVLLEIGLLRHAIQHNEKKNVYYEVPSLQMWADYLPNAAVIGFDLHSFQYKGKSNIQIVQGDQSSREDLSKIKQCAEAFDMIIDDALHASRHQQITFSFLFRYLKPGGVFIIEDLHFQPAEFEEAEIPKTYDLLESLHRTGKWNSPLATEEEKKYIEMNVNSIKFFDSLKKNIGKEGRDAIAVIYKK